MNDKDREPRIAKTAIVEDSVELGDWSVVHEHADLRGDIKIGRAAWINPYSIIGGGQKELGSLHAGDFLHMGIRSFVNIADQVVIGNEVGLGVETKIFTHGGYLNQYEGFPFVRGPVWIGDRVWIPNAIVLPNVRIESDVVISALSLVNKSLKKGGLYGGTPIRLLTENQYPNKLADKPVITEQILFEAQYYGVKADMVGGSNILVGKTLFVPDLLRIEGPANQETERVKDLFRRRGVRFRYYDNQGVYSEWD